MEESEKNKRPALDMPEKPWQEGYNSGLSGYWDECPYSVTSRNGWAWSAGQIEGLAARRQSPILG